MVSEIREAWFEATETATRLRDVLAVDEPGARLDAYAAFMGNQWATGAETLAIQQDAMRADPEVAAEIAAVLAERAERLKAVVVPLAPHLREPLTVETPLPSPVPTATSVASPSPAASTASPNLHFSNGTTLTVTLVVNEQHVGDFPPGGPDPTVNAAALPPVPWNVEA